MADVMLAPVVVFVEAVEVEAGDCFVSAHVHLGGGVPCVEVEIVTGHDGETWEKGAWPDPRHDTVKMFDRHTFWRCLRAAEKVLARTLAERRVAQGAVVACTLCGEDDRGELRNVGGE